MIGVTSNQNIDRNTLLGHMAFYHMPPIKLTHEQLETIFTQEGMPLSYLPAKIYGHDAFRRVTGKIRGTLSIQDTSGQYREAKLTVDEVRNDDTQILRAISRKFPTDSDDINFNVVGYLSYDKSTETVTTIPVAAKAYEYDYDGNILQPIVSEFEDAMQYHSKDTVRNIIGKIFTSLQPVTIIKGAYFIPKTNEDELLCLQNVIAALQSYASNTADVPEMRTIPLLDTIEQRSMIEHNITNELSQDIDTLYNELGEALSQGKELRAVSISRISLQLNEYRNKFQTYNSLLGTKLEGIEDILRDVIDRFATAQEPKGVL